MRKLHPGYITTKPDRITPKSAQMQKPGLNYQASRLKGKDRKWGTQEVPTAQGGRQIHKEVGEVNVPLPLRGSKQEAHNNAWGVPEKASRRGCYRCLLKDEE